MKTNKVMIRDMGGLDVHQRTKDGMFNATALLKQWSVKNNSKKVIAHFFENKATEEFIQALGEDFTHRNSVYVKSRASRGTNAGTWMHPYLFIDFAMWLNPKFKVKVIKFVYDELIKQRHLAGDNYLKLSESGMKLKGYDFREVAIAMQYIVFGNKGKGLRQQASQEQLKELNDLQSKLSFAIDMRYIKTYSSLIAEMQKIWKLKYTKQPIIFTGTIN
jgi:hypothetical protein